VAWLRSILLRHFAAREKRFRERIRELSRYTPFGARVKRNFWADSRPTLTAWKIVVRQVLRVSSKGSTVHAAVRKGIEMAHHAGVRSPRARISSATLNFGRVIAKQQYFHSHFGAGSASAVPEDIQEAHLRRLLAATLDEQRGMLDRTDLGRFKMWSTFAGPPDSPFAGISEQASAFRAAFALDEHPDPARDELLIFEYTLPVGTEPRIPTVIDAYAGPTWPAYFLPARPGAAHGYTDPWSGSGMDPRPEVVHEVITGRTLAARVRKVTG
jgi:hypothetical protein